MIRHESTPLLDARSVLLPQAVQPQVPRLPVCTNILPVYKEGLSWEVAQYSVCSITVSGLPCSEEASTGHCRISIPWIHMHTILHRPTRQTDRPLQLRHYIGSVEEVGLKGAKTRRGGGRRREYFESDCDICWDHLVSHFFISRLYILHAYINSRSIFTFLFKKP